jgi:LytS/YehU family sensor histidine kinase
LKSQLSPHYLFNSLNTISSLIHKDKGSAEEFIRRLADTYTYILRTHKQPLVTIREEIEFVKAYYYLLCVRYREGLKLDLNIPDQLLVAKVPPMTLQILVENAIKHNVFSKDEPLNIYIGVIDNTTIRVINNKTAQPTSVTSTKIGLNNIEMRYSYFTRNKIKIANGANFEVNVPILRENIVTTAA